MHTIVGQDRTSDGMPPACIYKSNFDKSIFKGPSKYRLIVNIDLFKIDLSKFDYCIIVVQLLCPLKHGHPTLFNSNTKYFLFCVLTFSLISLSRCELAREFMLYSGRCFNISLIFPRYDQSLCILENDVHK